MKIFKIMMALSMLMTYGEVSAAVYKSIDANGNVVYSDEPSKTAQLVNLPPLTIVPGLSQSAIDKTLASDETNKQRQVGTYQLNFLAPVADQTFRKTEPIVVNVSAAPALSGSDTLSILFDGMVVAQGTAASIPTENVDRGEHRVSARVMNANGQIVSENSLKVYVQQASVNMPSQKKN